MLLHAYSHPTLDRLRHFVVFPYKEAPKSEMRSWCRAQYGEPSPRSKLSIVDGFRWRDSITVGEIEFADEADMAFFVLRWGG